MSAAPEKQGIDRLEMFLRKTRPADGCLVWTGSKSKEGYGNFWNGERAVRAHRYAYERFVEPIPDGLTIDHLCGNPSCVKPSHLDPVTIRENVLRGNGMGARYRRRTHCKNGHKFEAETTTLRVDGRRDCRICDGEYRRRRYANGYRAPSRAK